MENMETRQLFCGNELVCHSFERKSKNTKLVEEALGQKLPHWLTVTAFSVKNKTKVYFQANLFVKKKISYICTVSDISFVFAYKQKMISVLDDLKNQRSLGEEELKNKKTRYSVVFNEPSDIVIVKDKNVKKVVKTFRIFGNKDQAVNSANTYIQKLLNEVKA
jgi:hypothetical protein